MDPTKYNHRISNTLALRSLLSILLFFIAVTAAGAQAPQGAIDVEVDALGPATAGFGVSMGYSPCPAFDAYLGTLVYPPSLELHAHARWNILDFPMTPFIQLSASAMYQIVMDAPSSPVYFYLRAHAGVKWQTSIGLFMGLSVGYNLFGDDMFSIPVGGLPFWLGAFLGYRFGL
jgi:hypothetical protein